MDINGLLEKIKKLEFHQRLLLQIVDHPNKAFFKLVIENSLGEEDVEAFFLLCEKINNEWEEQKAEGFVHFLPLFQKFSIQLHSRLKPESVIHACIRQDIFLPLMNELKKYA